MASSSLPPIVLPPLPLTDSGRPVLLPGEVERLLQDQVCASVLRMKKQNHCTKRIATFLTPPLFSLLSTGRPRLRGRQWGGGWSGSRGPGGERRAGGGGDPERPSLNFFFSTTLVTPTPTPPPLSPPFHFLSLCRTAPSSSPPTAYCGWTPWRPPHRGAPPSCHWSAWPGWK